ncbi:Cytochrome c-555 [Methylophilaceae bacterium]|nr:Cytochrome c-555 [Methylophilaceae bacterium]
MSDQHQDFPKTSISQVLAAIIGSLIAPVLVIILIVKLFMGVDASHIEDADPAVSAAKVEERIKPVAVVDVAEVAGAKVDMTGDVVYEKNCLACHTSGALGAPMLGNKAAWGPRIAQGYETLIKHAIEGIRQMPARGGNPDLTDGEIANAVAYMANEAGARFNPPAAAAPVEEEAVAAPIEETAVAKAAPAPAAEEKSSPAAAVATEPVASIGKAGEQTFQAVCAMCHNSGLMGAPKVGDKAGWAPRIAQGKDTLIQHGIKGIRMMPAKGGNPGLSDDEVAQAVIYMANESGASF